MYRYRVLVTRVVDGDTFDAKVDLGFHMTAAIRFRLRGIDTPETWRPKTEAERKHGILAKNRVIDLIEGKEVTILTEKSGKYGRWIATVLLQDRVKTLSELLVSEGFEKRAEYPL